VREEQVFFGSANRLLLGHIVTRAHCAITPVPSKNHINATTAVEAELLASGTTRRACERRADPARLERNGGPVAWMISAPARLLAPTARPAHALARYTGYPVAFCGCCTL
jgi:hypothetical protein